MRTLRWFVLWLAFACPPAYGQTVSQVSTIDGSSDSLRNPPALDDIIIVSYYANPADGGGGTFVNSGTSLCTGFYPVEGDDGGVVVQATVGFSHACYYRQFSGAVHLKWYGVTNGQDIASSCYGSKNCLQQAFTASQQFGCNTTCLGPVGTVDTDGLRIRSSTSVVIPQQERLTCSAPFTGLIALSDYSDVGGAIVLDHLASIYIATNAGLTPALNGDQVEFDHCIVLTKGDGGAAISLDPSSADDPHRQAIINYQSMVTNGDTGIFCDGAEQPYIHDVTVIGFDTGVTSFNCGRFRLEHANIDADVPVYIADGKSVAHLSHISAQPFLSRGVTSTDLNKKRNLSYAVTKVVPGAGTPPACRVTLPRTPAPNVAAGDYVYVNGDGNYHPGEGVLGCEGLHVAAAVSGSIADFDLLGTSCPSTDCYGSGTAPFLITNATWAQHSQLIHVNDTAGVHANETVSSATDGGVFTGAAKVISVSPYNKIVVVDQFTKDASSGSQTMNFTNTGSCPSGCGLTLYDFAAVHIAAGNSLGGLATNHLAACIRAGGPGDTSALGVIADDIFCGQYQIEYDLESADPFTCTGCGFDNEPDLADSSQIAALYGHATKPLALSGTVDASDPTKVHGFTITGTSVNITALHAGWFTGYEVYNDSTDVGSINSVSADGLTITLSGAAGSTGAAVNLTIPNPSQEDTGAADFVGTDFGSGGGVIVDSPNGYCNAMQGGIVKPNGADVLAVEFVNGCANINLSTNKSNDVLVGANAGAGSSVIGSNLPSGAFFFENATAAQKFGALGNFTHWVEYPALTYQDGFKANTSTSVPLLTAGIDVVTSCAHSSCSGDEVMLPDVAGSLDTSSTPVGSACKAVGGGNCGAAATVTVVNNYASTITVVPQTGQTINGSSSTTLLAHSAKTFLPVTGGWIATTVLVP